ncbi:putative quinol monooxygenase [Bosea sp. BK604]|uniref:putative quinol monooxygenase n=1 Tax=Bosea sp. BK604 TaxID=2512180 RepID=UPI00104DAE2E|nr:putative quinol monooxygenase [Bosea sp. BK604]TCR66547.1 quinol monooxygenase YgiN [Bosea sp. BK604]
MYGMIVQMLAAPGKREELVAILTESTGAMPGCLSYVVALDAANPDAVWVSEAWDSKGSHAASLELPEVKAAIARGRPLIGGMGTFVETQPVGGHGLVAG